MTKDQACVVFLQWALPQLGFRWPGFRKVRRQVCRRLVRRCRELDLEDLDAYRAHLASHPGEWAAVDAACRVTISRFYRDRETFESLGREVLPALARAAMERGEDILRVWSAGCASGEEPYSVRLVWEHLVAPRFPGLELRITATDADAQLLARARRACYSPSGLRELPADWLAEAFSNGELRQSLRQGIDFRHEDLRQTMPEETFDVVLCRNLAFTYFEVGGQRQVLAGIDDRLVPGGALVIGSHESLPPGAPGVVAWPKAPGVFRWV